MYTYVYSEIRKEENHMGDLDVDGRIRLKGSLKKDGTVYWILVAQNQGQW
jgi:hypothetical protein